MTAMNFDPYGRGTGGPPGEISGSCMHPMGNSRTQGEEGLLRNSGKRDKGLFDASHLELNHQISLTC